MTDTEKIAKWAGIKCWHEWAIEFNSVEVKWKCEKCGAKKLTYSVETFPESPPAGPDYLNGPAVYGLLDVLVGRGYSPCLFYDLDSKWSIEIYCGGDFFLATINKPTIHEAIVAAVLEVIRREEDNDLP
jgi:hypothetical protein